MAKDVIITPASGKLDFYGTAGGSVLANINLTDNNDLSLSTTSGNLIIGDASRDVYIGDGTNEVDIVFEQNGEIRSVAGKYITVNAGTVNATGVAVNTSSPTAVMHVYGSTPSGTVLNVEGTNGSLFSVVDNLDGTLMSVNNNAGLPVLEVFSNDSIVGGRFGQNDFVVSSSGNIGIGVANPSTKLEINGTIKLRGASSTTSQIYIDEYGEQLVIDPAGTSFGETYTASPFYVANALLAGTALDTLVVTSDTDRVGIGTSSPSTKLEVNGTVTATTFSGAGTSLTGTAASLTAGSVTNGVYTTGNQSIGGVKTFTSQIINTTANNTANGGGQIYLNGANGNRIDFNTNGVAAPTFTTRSAGTKIVLYPNVGASSADYAIGIESSTIWQSVPTTSQQFKWYAGTTNIATLNGLGQLETVNAANSYTNPALTLRATYGGATQGSMRLLPQVDGAGSIITFNSSAHTTTNGVIVTGSSTLTGYHSSRKQGAFQWVAGVSDSTSRFEFLTANGGTTGQTVTSRMAITAAGNVGIGTNTPVDKLTISAGSINISNDGISSERNYTVKTAGLYGRVVAYSSLSGTELDLSSDADIEENMTISFYGHTSNCSIALFPYPINYENLGEIKIIHNDSSSYSITFLANFADGGFNLSSDYVLSPQKSVMMQCVQEDNFGYYIWRLINI